MDAVMSSMLASALEGYFGVFFKNFRREDFKLNLSGNETTTSMHNLEIREEVVQEVMGVPNLGVQRVFINTLVVKVKPTQIRSNPLRIAIDRIDVVLSEPWETLKPLPKVIEQFMAAMLPNKGQPGTYGFVEQLIDGLRVDINQISCMVHTVGRYKTAEKGDWTPPVVFADVKGVSVYTTNERWEVVDLKQAREFNNNRQEIYVFKELTINSINAYTVGSTNEQVPLITNLPVVAHITMRKALDNKLLGISINATISALKCTLNMEHMATVVAMMEGISTCMERPDNPDPPAVEIPHLTLLCNIVLKDLSLALVENGGNGVELIGRNIEVGVAWPENSPVQEKLIDVCVGYIGVREFSTRSGPKSHFLLQPNESLPSKDPFTVIPPLPKTLHPTEILLREEGAPVFYMKGLVRSPPQRPKFDRELQAVLNPIEVIMRPESVTSLAQLAQAITPYTEQLVKRNLIKPPGDLSSVMVVEPKDSLEDLVSLKVEFQSITVSFPSKQKAAFSRISIALSDGKILSHPNLPASTLWSQGLGALREFPNSDDDTLATREQVFADAKHVVKYKVISKFELTVQAAPDVPPECTMEIPQINLDLSIALGPRADAEDNAIKKSKMEVKLMEGTMYVKEFFGRLTQWQYKNIVKRIDELIPLIPVAIGLARATKDVEVPKTNLVFFAKIDHGECCLCNDYTRSSEPSPTGQPVELLAGLEVNGLQMCFENLTDKKVAKVILNSVKINALPNPPLQSPLYNPNAFLSVGDENTPLLQIRLVHAANPKTESGPGAKRLRIGKRSLAAVRISGFRFGINPNPTVKIIYFFLNTDRTLADIMRTAKQAQEALENVDFAEMRRMARDIDIDTENVDIDVSVDNTKLFLLRDLTDDAPKGNACFQFDKMKILKHAETAEKEQLQLLIENLAVVCNKDENGQVNTAYTFEPLTLNVESTRVINPTTDQWEVTTKGGMNKLEIAVTPVHSGVFMNVVGGVKKENVRMLADGFARYMERKPIEEEEIDVSTSSNPFSETLEALDGILSKADQDIVRAAQDKESMSANMRALEQATGQGNVLSRASRTGFLSVLQENKTWGKRFFALVDDALYVFEQQQSKTPLAKLTINKQTLLEMVNNVPNCFQITAEHRLIVAAGNEQTMSGWVNELLRVQLGDGSQPADALGRLAQEIAGIKKVRNDIADMSKFLGEKATLLQRIKELEAEIRQRDARIQVLEAARS